MVLNSTGELKLSGFTGEDFKGLDEFVEIEDWSFVVCSIDVSIRISLIF